MCAQIYPAQPSENNYDVVIIGGAIVGSSIAWFLSQQSEFLICLRFDFVFAGPIGLL